MCMWFGYNPWVNFCYFFHFVNFVIFWIQILWKCIDSGYLVSATPYTISIFSSWNFAHLFFHGLKIYMWFGFNPAVNFCHFSTLSFFNFSQVWHQLHWSLIYIAFVWEKGKTMDFSETVVVCDVKVGRWVHENIWISKVKVIHWLCPRSLRFTFSNFFSLENAWPIEARFHVEPPWDGGMKVCSNGPGPGHMTNMATMPIYGKNLKIIFFSGTKQLMTSKAGMQHRVLEYYQGCCSNDDLGLLDLFYSKVKFGPLCFCIGKR